MSEKRITVWVQNYGDRSNLTFMWIDPITGKRKSQSAETDNRAVAEMKRTILEADLNRGLHKEVSRMTWERFREMFEDEYVTSRRLNTREGYGFMFDSFERLCSPTSLRAVSARTISTFAAKLRKEPGKHGSTMQESTIKVRLQFLHTALAWAVKQKLIPECPEFPVIRPPKRKPQPVSSEVFERMLAKAPDEQTRVFLLCGWLAGLRLAEAVALEWEETEEAPYLDLDRDRIVFPAGFVKAVEDQWVPLDRDLRAALLALPRQGRSVFRFVDAKERPVKLKAVGKRVVELGKLAGVKLTMKSLRRGFGCYWAARVSAQVLQKLMRHHNIALTLTYYANVDNAATQAILSRESDQAVLNSKANPPQQTIKEEL